jgi:hypothetical protein
VKTKYILGTLLVGALLYFSRGHQAPQSQPPLANLTAQNLADVKDRFNAAKSEARLLLLMSPT